MKRYSEEEVRDLVSRAARLRNADVAELEKQEEYLNTQVKLLEELSAGLEEVIDNYQEESIKLLDRIDHLESVYWKHWGEREELRTLCQDLYRSGLVASELKFDTTDKWVRIFKPRMEQLGLLDGEQ